MADIELVIKIPEGAYKLLKNEGVDWLGAEHILNAVANGTPLPKGHGDLIDIDDIRVIELEDSLHIIRHEKGDEIDVYIDAPTIIKAESENKTDNTIEYTSENGYKGVLYGKGSMSIYDPDGRECLHTGSRSINTYEELVKTVDEHPQFMEMLRKYK